MIFGEVITRLNHPKRLEVKTQLHQFLIYKATIFHRFLYYEGRVDAEVIDESRCAIFPEKWRKDFKSLKTRNAGFCDEMRGGRIKSLWLKVCHHRKMTNKAFQDLFQSLDGEVKRSFQQIDCDILVLEKAAHLSTLSPSGSLDEAINRLICDSIKEVAYATDDNAIIWKLEKQSFSLQFLETMQHWSDREKAIVAYLKSVAHSEQYRPFTHLQLFFRLVAKSLVRIQDRAKKVVSPGTKADCYTTDDGGSWGSGYGYTIHLNRFERVNRIIF